jgi:hypothetical protein
MITNSCQLLEKKSYFRPRLASFAAILAVGLLLAASSARADEFTFTSDHCSGGCGPQAGGFGTVTVTQNGTNVDITVSLLNNNKFVLTGSADFQYFKFNGTGVAVGDITNISQNFPGFTLSAATGSFNGDGTGDFTFGITSDHGNGGSPPQFAGPISFTVQNATIADLTVANADGNIFVADILSGTTGKTGPVDVNTGGNNTPDAGSTAALLGLALLGLGLVRKPLLKKA